MHVHHQVNCHMAYPVPVSVICVVHCSDPHWGDRLRSPLRLRDTVLWLYQLDVPRQHHAAVGVYPRCS